MKRLLAGLALVVLLIGADLAVYVADNGMECRAGGCSALVDVTRALFFPLVVLAAALLLALVAKAVAGAVRSGR